MPETGATQRSRRQSVEPAKHRIARASSSNATANRRLTGRPIDRKLIPSTSSWRRYLTIGDIGGRRFASMTLRGPRPSVVGARHFAETVGPDHPDTVGSRRDLAMVAAELGNYQ